MATASLVGVERAGLLELLLGRLAPLARGRLLLLGLLLRGASAPGGLLCGLPLALRGRALLLGLPCLGAGRMQLPLALGGPRARFHAPLSGALLGAPARAGE